MAMNAAAQAEPTGRYFMVLVTDKETRATFGLSRREGDDFEGPWRLLDEEEAEELAETVNEDGGEAVVIEVYRYDNDPVWTEDKA